MKRCHAFTLIELMAAMTLAGMVMIVTMGLLVQINESAEDIQSSVESATWLNNLRDQFQQDFANCRSVLLDRNEVRIDGYSQFESSTASVRHLPVLIKYRIQGEWLIREEQRSTGNINDYSSRQLMGRGILNIQDLSNLDIDVPPGRWRLKVTYLDQTNTGSADRADNSKTRSVVWTLFRHGGGVQ